MATRKQDAPQNEQKTQQKNPIEQSMQALKSSETAQQLENSPVVQKGINPIREFFTKFSNDWTMNLQAGALAYSFLMAMLPIAVALLSIFGLVLGGLGEASRTALINGLKGALPGQQQVSNEVIQAIFQRLANVSGPLGIIAIVLAIVAGSRLFVMMENCFDLIYHRPPRKFLQQNIMAIGMIVLFAVLIPLIVAASSLPAVLFSFLNKGFLQNIPGGGVLVSVLGILGSLLVAVLMFLAIYIIVPNQKISFRSSWLGSVIGAVALLVYLTLFPLYATHFLGGYVGQVGFAIILIAFFYYFAVILLLGAEVNAFFGQGIRKTPDNLAAMVHKETSLDEKPPEEQREQAVPEHKDDMDRRENQKGQERSR